MKQNIVWGLVAVVVLAVGAFLPLGGQSVVERVVVGGSTSNSAHQYFGDQVTIGGKVFSTTTVVTQTAHTLTQANLGAQVIKILENKNFTLSIGATSTRDLVPNIGDTATIYLQNASTSATGLLTLAEVDASTDIVYSEGTGGDVVLEGGNWAKLVFVRNGFSGVGLVSVIVSEFVPL